MRLASELGATPLAEGIESEGEAKTCAELGFVLGQGYYFGRPAPAREYADRVDDSACPANT